MNNKDIVKNMVKLNVLTARYIARHTQLRFETYRDIERVATSNKLLITYGEAIEKLKEVIFKYCKECEYLITKICELEQAVQDSEVKDYRFGIEPKLKFTKEESELDSYRISRTLYMTNGMMGIGDLIKELPSLSYEQVNKACREEKLLNTVKTKNYWIVSIHECRSYWNIKDTNKEHLYVDWEY